MPLKNTDKIKLPKVLTVSSYNIKVVNINQDTIVFVSEVHDLFSIEKPLNILPGNSLTILTKKSCKQSSLSHLSLSSMPQSHPWHCSRPDAPCSFFFTVFLSRKSTRYSPTAFPNKPIPLSQLPHLKHSLENHWPCLPIHQVGCVHYPSSPTIPIPHSYSHLCSGPPTVVSPFSLPLVSRTYKDLSGTETF